MKIIRKLTKYQLKEDSIMKFLYNKLKRYKRFTSYINSKNIVIFIPERIAL